MDKINREFSAEEVIHILSENTRLKNENNKLRFVIKTIHSRNENLKIENGRLQRDKDIRYIKKREQHFDSVCNSLRKDKDELNGIIEGLKKEIEWYKSKCKK